ncbi:argininosuccinate synthase, truncation [Streptococcus pneumoniae]|nr:argininosuccinate synthase, truncation [Streptococcus pneumoniae]
MSKEKVILAYSGGLDTSVAITWLKKDYDVVAVCMDVGEGKDLDFIHDKALKVGAVESYVIDVKDEFATDYVLVALQSHAYYEQKYPLVSALSRPLISKKLVEMERLQLLMVVQVRGMTKSNTRLQSLRKRMKLKSDGVMGSE